MTNSFNCKYLDSNDAKDFTQYKGTITIYSKEYPWVQYLLCRVAKLLWFHQDLFMSSDSTDENMGESYKGWQRL